MAQPDPPGPHRPTVQDMYDGLNAELAQLISQINNNRRVSSDARDQYERDVGLLDAEYRAKNSEPGDDNAEYRQKREQLRAMYNQTITEIREQHEKLVIRKGHLRSELWNLRRFPHSLPYEPTDIPIESQYRYWPDDGDTPENSDNE